MLPELEEIIVTGTNIRSIENTSSPVIVFDRKDIDLTGLSTVDQLIETLPQNFAGGASEDNIAGRGTAGLNSSRGSGVNLRGLGTASTLVLLNGRRLQTSGFGSFVDVSGIPLSAVERVEVLTDGASSIYGSDAVAGVVNFILKDAYDGGQTLLRVGNVTEGEATEYQAAQTIGRKWTSGGFLAGYDFRRRNRLSASSRDFTNFSQPNNDITSEREIHSGFISLNQAVTDNLDGAIDVLYSHRDFAQNSNTVFLQNLSGTQESLSIGAGLDWALSERWSVRADGVYSLGRLDRIGVTPDGSRPDSEIFQDSDLWSINLVADGPVLSLPGGDLSVAIGGEYREETLDGTTNSVSNRSRDVAAFFAETNIPIIGSDNQLQFLQRFDVNASVRFEEYSDFGSNTTFKTGAVLSPVEGLDIRGSYGTAFRAPTLPQLSEDPQNLVFSFFLPDPASPTGQTLSVIRVGGFNPELQPEEAITWTIGARYAPPSIPGAKFELNYFNVDYKERIAELDDELFNVLSEAEIFAPLISAPPPIGDVNALIGLPSFSNFSGPFVPGDVGAIIDLRLNNIGVTEVDGLDFSGSYTTDSAIGDLTFGVNGTYLFSFENFISPTADGIDVVDTIFNPVDLRIRGSAAWSHNGFTLNGFVNYTDSYSGNAASPDAKIRAWTTVDIRASYAFEDQNRSALDGLTISLSAQNLFNKEPPQIPAASDLIGAGYDAENSSPLGRFIALQITKDW